MNYKQIMTGAGFRRVFLMLVLVVLPTTALVAQEEPVTISSRNISVRDAINEIEAQTGYVIGFRNKDFDASKQVTLPATQGTARKILGYLLSGSGYTWETNGDYIIIIPDPQPKPVMVAKAEPVAPAPEPTPVSAYVPALPKPEVVQGVTIPAEVMRFALTPEPEPMPDPRGNYTTVRRMTETPHWAIKSNLLFDATLTVSLGAEIRLGRKTTLDVPLTHNSWGRINNRQWENFSIQPGVRLWTCEAFNGFFWGFHTHYAKYNFSNLPSPPFTVSMRDYRYEGHLAGAGMNAGYQWILGNRWAIEAELGLGYARLWYDKYPCDTCGRLIGSETKNYFGPTKAAVSLIFIIK